MPSLIHYAIQAGIVHFSYTHPYTAAPQTYQNHPTQQPLPHQPAQVPTPSPSLPD